MPRHKNKTAKKKPKKPTKRRRRGTLGSFYERSDFFRHVATIEKVHEPIGMLLRAGWQTQGRVSEVLGLTLEQLTPTTVECPRLKGSLQLDRGPQTDQHLAKWLREKMKMGSPLGEKIWNITRQRVEQVDDSYDDYPPLLWQKNDHKTKTHPR